jgi:hypothetical protein
MIFFLNLSMYKWYIRIYVIYLCTEMSKGATFRGTKCHGRNVCWAKCRCTECEISTGDCGVLRRGGVRLTRRKVETDSASSPCGLSTVKVYKNTSIQVYKYTSIQELFWDSFYCTYSTSSLKQKLQWFSHFSLIWLVFLTALHSHVNISW